VRPPKTVLPLSLSKASVRFLDKLPPKQYRQVTRKVIMLMADPQPADAERLRGHEYSRVTVGEYRVIFDVHDGVLRSIAIGKRNDDEVYRRLSRA
jgi:mRNA interferase RelE/StbE